MIQENNWCAESNQGALIQSEGHGKVVQWIKSFVTHAGYLHFNPSTCIRTGYRSIY